MKNIVFFARRFGIGGAETFLMNLFERINKEKYNITLVLAISDEKEDLYEKEAKKLGINIIHINELTSLTNHIRYIKSVYKFLRKGNYDIVHSNTGSFDGIILLISKLAKIDKRICHAHSFQSQANISSGIKKVLRDIYFSFMKKLMIYFSTDRIACSEKAYDYFFGKAEGTVIYNGVNTNLFTPVEQNKKTELIKEYIPSAPLKKYYIISVGRVSFEKNVFFAIHTINELRKTRDDFCYFWVGDGEFIEEAKSLVDTLNLDDTVIFTGARTDVPQLLPCCDVFILPSLFEGLGFSLLEAQFSGLKCIASTGVPTIADIGRTEFLPLDAGEKKWAQKINETFEKKNSPLIEEKAKLFDIEQTVKHLEAIYDK